MADRIRRIFLSSDSAPHCGETKSLPSDEVHHLIQVLRHRESDIIEVCFPSWRSLFSAQLQLHSGYQWCLELLEDLSPSQKHTSQHQLLFALCKGDTNEWVIEKASELNVAQIIFWQGDRSVVRLDAQKRTERQLRFEKIAEAAAKQSHRIDFPQVQIVKNLQEAIHLLPPSSPTNRFLCSLEDQAKPLCAYPYPQQGASFLVGPEGDFSAEEYTLAKKNSFSPLRLAANILRSETAALTALAQAQAAWKEVLL